MSLAALGALALITAGWWALALWPAPAGAPEWLARARLVCFHAPPDGVPDASGWLLLVGQPLGMLGVLLAAWGAQLRRDLARLAARPGGRLVLSTAAGLVALGLGAAGARVAPAAPPAAVAPAADEIPAENTPRLDREAPELGLVAQAGESVELGDLRGRPALVTFAFAHCERVCPLVVRETVGAQRLLRERAEAGALARERVPRVVVVTLDPWRDTPARLPHLARAWGLGDDGFALSGAVDEVNAVLDRWGVPRERNPATGDVAHPPLVYVLAPDGRIAFASTGGSAALAALALRS
jgi:cytochrome oxidase Cu insertion factor (SCO1/SenC/PrrC family)